MRDNAAFGGLTGSDPPGPVLADDLVKAELFPDPERSLDREIRLSPPLKLLRQFVCPFH